jgi:HD superfamily phosphohydrolase
LFKRSATLKINLLFLFLLPYILCARQIDTFYGSIEVDEPIILELIDSPIFQRLKNIHQYGIAYYTTHREEYNRYDHSIGVFAILKLNNSSIEEQIAGLLHDVSHTAFSHVGDWVFGKENQDRDYQNDIHLIFLKESGLADILKKYNFTAEQILPEEELFPSLENRLPNLCADRIDYNIQGAYYRGFITYKEAVSVFKSLRFINNRWVSNDPTLMKKLTRFSLFMTKDCWGSPTNYVTSRWLADAILRAIDLECISYTDFHYGTDQEIWDKLILQKDSIIKEKMKMIMNPEAYFSIVNTTSEADYIVKSKFRGINPWVLSESQYKRITEIDDKLAEEYEEARQLITKGWLVKIFSNN